MATHRVSAFPRFPEGTKVEVLPRVSDGFTSAGVPAVWSGKVPQDGELKISGVQEFGQYWLTDGSAHVSFMVKPANVGELSTAEVTRRAAQVQTETSGSTPGLRSAAPGRNTGYAVIEGARDSKARRAQVRAEGEKQPFENQMDVSGDLQRSDTAYGEVHRKESAEPQPRPRQDQVKAGTVQRSDTEFGEATPKDPSEEQPAISQEDSPKGMLQRSDTEFGSIEPKPKSASDAAEVQKDVESSEAKAEGRSKAKPAAKTTPKAKGATSEGAVKKSAGKKDEPADVISDPS